LSDLLGVAPVLTGSVSFGGLRAYGLGHAVDPDAGGTIYLSMVGYRTAVRGVWAALMNNDAIELKGQLLRRAEGAYLTRTSRLEECGLDHMVLLHHQAAIPHLEAGQPFYVLNHDNTPPIHRFFAGLDRAATVPLLKHWGDILWTCGMKEQLIERIPKTRGINAWRVNADGELWLAVIKDEIANGALRL
jgi:hypothetical protein